MDLESMSAKEVASWLGEKGFCEEVTKAFEEQDMDGEAIGAVFASAPGPDSLKDVLPKLGQRLKVYKAIKSLVEVEATEAAVSDEESIVDTATIQSTSTVRISDDLTKQSPASHKRSPPDNVEIGCASNSGIPNPFPIPRFRKLTQDKLDKKQFADDDRKHMVSVLGTMILTYKEKASRKDCLCVAESLIRKYPFLKDPHWWQHYIYNKCQNANRHPATPSPATPAKRPKLSNDNNAHSYPKVDGGEDEVSYNRNLSLLEKELKGKHPSKTKLKELMERTFAERRKWILGSAVSAKEIWTKFPLLKKPSFICDDFHRIMKRPCQEDYLADGFKWFTAANEYSLSTVSPSTSLRCALKDYPPDPTEEEAVMGNPHEWELLTALRCLGSFLILKKRGGGSDTSVDYDIPFVLRICPSGTPPADCIDTNNNLPFIVKICHADYECRPQYFIAFEQELVIDCSSSLFHSVFVLIAIHYVFNVVYHSRLKNFFLFLEEKVLALPSQKGSKSASYSSVVTGIESFLQE